MGHRLVAARLFLTGSSLVVGALWCAAGVAFDSTAPSHGI
ncbi:putative membrane protein [Mycobacterium kansasii]|uniref:Putative membrane protein n=1 Tax=Mycobacterium kansasii TaxID=1768 RepID=A0A1V3XNH8_MYCKA|nr:putative membrane protein [Mycobacterium kansasii]OOK80739.1 putative membrane protein [Mycobacterium kansasii]